MTSPPLHVHAPEKCYLSAEQVPPPPRLPVQEHAVYWVDGPFVPASFGIPGSTDPDLQECTIVNEKPKPFAFPV